jgi:RNHCP domain
VYEEIYEQSTIKYWGKLKSSQRQWRLEEKKYAASITGFKCHHCQAYVYTQTVFSGVQNRNHCPYCLWSRHVDYIQPGDRMSACKACMQPIGLTVKGRRNKYRSEITGELMLIHCCDECGKLSINRIAADDQTDRLMELYRSSTCLDQYTLEKLEKGGVRLLRGADLKLVVSQLWGNQCL